MSLDLRSAVRTANAIRFDLPLQPPGGSIHKVFPPTYPGPDKKTPPRYAMEDRRIDGEAVMVALLDSIPSQANRLEQALLDASRTNRIRLPFIEVAIEGHGVVTDLEAPHRVYDAILLDSHLNGQPFLKSSIGNQLGKAMASNATSLFTYAPAALIFGAWNSHAGQRIGMARFPRALTSEIIGWPVLRGVKTASRIDPLGIMKGTGAEMYVTEDGRWTFDPARARKDKNGHPVKGKKPSELGHGNIAPSIDDTTGGISIQHARQIAVLTLAQLRNLHFPVTGETASEERDIAARTVLAALALVALLEQWERGYQLRSGCLLQPLRRPEWRLCGRTAEEDAMFDLDTGQAHALLEGALAEAARYRLEWPSAPLRLVASPDLQRLVKDNNAMLAVGIEEEE